MTSKTRGLGFGTLFPRIAFILLLLVTGLADAQPGREGSYDLSQSGRDLMDVDLMFVGAHPDDDSGIMATFARYLLDEGFKGTVVTFTGGDGGGNATGREAGKALGLIRQEEERRALALIGVEAPHFLGQPDFYFTLSAEETERKWGENFLCDLTRIVRLERPEVMVTMWPGPGTHGQHQMAARAATLAFAKAADESYCPEQITREKLEPFQPLKLYYYNRDSPTSVEIPAGDYSRAAYRRYADIRALAMSMYRSQGFDQFLRIPVEEVRAERFMLVRSMVPIAEPETHLLEGALIPADRSPPGIELRVSPESHTAGFGVTQDLTVHFVNGTSHAIEELQLVARAPAGWQISAAGTAEVLGPGESREFRFAIEPTPAAVPDRNQRVEIAYQATHLGRTIGGKNFAWMKAVAPVRITFAPTYDVAGYRRFARETGTEWVIETLPSRLPLTIGRRNPVTLTLHNLQEVPARGEIELELPEGVEVHGDRSFELAEGETAEVRLDFELDATVLPAGRQTVRRSVKATTSVGSIESSDAAEIYALPLLTIPRVSSAPSIDGDLTDMEAHPGSEISPSDLWWRRDPESDEDASASFHAAYDEQFLYVGVRVRDQTVVCNIAPDDIRAQLRSDAVGITVDPTGRAQDTSTVMQAAAFPCTTESFAARGFRDADANQGVMEETAPGMKVASRKTDDGYQFEAALPWSAMPHQPKPGDEIAMNLVIYDGDLENARVGANISESGLAWAAFPLGGKQALPYLWPRVVLAR